MSRFCFFLYFLKVGPPVFFLVLAQYKMYAIVLSLARNCFVTCGGFFFSMKHDVRLPGPIARGVVLTRETSQVVKPQLQLNLVIILGF